MEMRMQRCCRNKGEEEEEFEGIERDTVARH